MKDFKIFTQKMWEKKKNMYSISMYFITVMSRLNYLAAIIFVILIIRVRACEKGVAEQ